VRGENAVEITTPGKIRENREAILKDGLPGY
jgi:hypothetical protein